MFEHLKTPEDAFNFKLGAGLKMERTVLEILGHAIDHARDERVETLLREHHGESEEHVRVVEEAFGLLDSEVDEFSCPAIEGLQKEAKASLKKTDGALVDVALLQGALEVEHHELAVYENLLIAANGIGRDDVLKLLHHNFESEQDARDKVRVLLGDLVAPKQHT